MSTSTQPVRVGLVGAGMIGRAHMGWIVGAGGWLTAIADPDTKAAKESADKWKVPHLFTDPKQMLKLDEIDAVVIAVPNYLHAPIALAALKAGKHVLIEKPMAMNVAECKKINAAARKANRHVQVGLFQRYQAESQLAKRMILEGRLGEVYHAVATAVRRRGVPGRGGWFTTKKKSGGGPLIDIGVHILDLTTWLMGQPRPVAVSAQTHQRLIHRSDYTYLRMWSQPTAKGTIDVEDYATALIRFDNGASCSLECAWAANIPQNGWQSQILGDKAGLIVRPGTELIVSGQEGNTLMDSKPVYEKVDHGLHQFEQFFAACRNGTVPVTPGFHGQYIQAILDGIYKSAAQKREVRIPASDLPKAD